jgi:hypothetical protein
MLIMLAGRARNRTCVSYLCWLFWLAILAKLAAYPLFIHWLILLVIMVGYEAVMQAESSGWIFCLSLMAILVMLAGFSSNAV